MYYQTSNNAYGSWSHNNQQYVQTTNNYHQQQPRMMGLVNLGNTCYINSILQSIFDVLIFPQQTYKKSQLITYLYSKLQQSHSNQDYVEFKKHLGNQLDLVLGNQQQDAHEFLTGLLQILNKENQLSKGSKPKFNVDHKLNESMNWGKFCDQMRKIDNSKVIDMFGGQLYTQLLCAQRHRDYLFQRFLNISIPIPNNYSYQNLQKLLKENSRQQILSDVTCEKCNYKTQRSKRSVIYNPPRMLVIHLKRFQQGFWSNSKINTPVVFDQILELKPDYVHPDTMTMSCIYDLVSIVHHTGTLNGGHYYTQKRIGNQWFLYNDVEVTPCQLMPKDNISETAYIFFYQLR